MQLGTPTKPAAARQTLQLAGPDWHAAMHAGACRALVPIAADSSPISEMQSPGFVLHSGVSGPPQGRMPITLPNPTPAPPQQASLQQS